MEGFFALFIPVVVMGTIGGILGGSMFAIAYRMGWLEISPYSKKSIADKLTAEAQKLGLYDKSKM